MIITDLRHIQASRNTHFVFHSSFHSYNQRNPLKEINGESFYYEMGYNSWKAYSSSDELVAHFTVYSYRNYIVIHRLSYTEVKYRSNGVGEALVSQIVEFARQMNLDYIVAVAENPEHIAFLRPMGFVQDSHLMKQILYLSQTTSQPWWKIW